MLKNKSVDIIDNFDFLANCNVGVIIGGIDEKFLKLVLNRLGKDVTLQHFWDIAKKCRDFEFNKILLN